MVIRNFGGIIQETLDVNHLHIRMDLEEHSYKVTIDRTEIKITKHEYNTEHDAPGTIYLSGRPATSEAIERWFYPLETVLKSLLRR